jgi:hypothetical protein
MRSALAGARRLFRSPLRAAAAAAILSASLVAGAAYASIPDSSGVIHGCSQKVNGQLRVIDTNQGQSCSAAETPISWNQTGPAGPQGPPGTPAPAGATILSFGYPVVGDCGQGVFFDHPSPNPCPFKLVEAPRGVTVTLVTNPSTSPQPPYGYCLAGLRSVPRTILDTVGTEQDNSDGSINDYITSSLGSPSLEIQQPPSFCPSGSQLIVRWLQLDGVGGAFCSSLYSSNCVSVVYRLILG